MFGSVPAARLCARGTPCQCGVAALALETRAAAASALCTRADFAARSLSSLTLSFNSSTFFSTSLRSTAVCLSARLALLTASRAACTAASSSTCHSAIMQRSRVASQAIRQHRTRKVAETPGSPNRAWHQVGFAHKDACGAEVRGCDIVLEERARIADQARQTAILTQERVVAFGVCTVVAGQSQQYQYDPSDNHRDAGCLLVHTASAQWFPPRKAGEGGE